MRTYFPLVFVLFTYGFNLHAKAADGGNKGNYNNVTPKRGPPGRWQSHLGERARREVAGPDLPTEFQQRQQHYAGQAAAAAAAAATEGRVEQNSWQPSQEDGNKQVEQGEGGKIKSRFPGDRVPMYTKKFHHRVAVSLVAFVSSSALAMVLVRAVFSKPNILVSMAFAIACFLSCYVEGDLSQFSNALGVATILFLRKLRLRQFLTTSTRQLLSTVYLAGRRSFPPVENPWSCKDVLDASEVPFSMIKSLMGMLFFGMLFGYNVSKRIPLLPGWIGGLTASILLGYTTTTRNSKGDLLRYLGHSINVMLSEVVACADDVYFREKTGVVLNKTFFFINRLDKRFGIIENLRAVFNKILELVRGLRADMEAERREGLRSEGGSLEALYK